MGIKKSIATSLNKRDIRLFRGDPNCLAFYNWAHGKLQAATFAWPPPITALKPGRQGNLGEFLTYQVAVEDGLGGIGHYPALGGATTPLQDATQPGVDILIAYLDPTGDSSKDKLVLIEVKTTGGKDLAYSAALVEDCQKLLGDTAISTSLATRMNALTNHLMYVHKLDTGLIQRAQALFMPRPHDCTAVKLVPTLVHDLGSTDAIETLDEVARQIEALGWLSSSIEPWSIAMNQLISGLIHLCNNEAFTP